MRRNTGHINIVIAQRTHGGRGFSLGSPYHNCCAQLAIPIGDHKITMHVVQVKVSGRHISENSTVPKNVRPIRGQMNLGTHKNRLAVLMAFQHAFISA